MLLKDLSDVSLQDVQVLCDNHVLESRSLDFKATAIDRGDRGKREFLATSAPWPMPLAGISSSASRRRRGLLMMSAELRLPIRTTKGCS